MKPIFLLAASFLVACSSGASSSGSESTTPAAPAAPVSSNEGGSSETSPTPRDGGAELSVSGVGLAFVPLSGGGRRAWSKPDTSKPADVLDVVLTEWTETCVASVPDNKRVVTLYARAVDHPGTYPITDTTILGGDGTTGQFSMIESTMLDRSTWPDDVRPECGYDMMTGTWWSSGTVTITRLDDEVVEGELDATDEKGSAAHAKFRVPLCLSRTPNTIGCGT